MIGMDTKTEALMKEAIDALRLANEKIARLEAENAALRQTSSVGAEIGKAIRRGPVNRANERPFDRSKLFTAPSITKQVSDAQKARKERS